MLPFDTLNIFLSFCPKTQSRAESSRAGAELLLFHCPGDTNHIQPHKSPGQGAEIPQAALMAEGKGSFLTCWLLLQLLRCCLLKQLGCLRRNKPQGHLQQVTLRAQAALPIHLSLHPQLQTLRATQLSHQLGGWKAEGSQGCGEKPSSKCWIN